MPWLTQPTTNTFEETETSVVLNGLQRLYPGRLNIAGIEQRVNATGTGDTTPTYTPVFISLIPAYTRTGVVTDTQDTPIAGATVEAIGKSGQRKFSVTNSAGVYYLEGLSQGEYTLTVNGNSQLRLKLDASTKPFQELNLKAKV
ncbi:MAG: carboxypeptidase-like regulatory domain-containing protein [Chroococcidiopsis sp.]